MQSGDFSTVRFSFKIKIFSLKNISGGIKINFVEKAKDCSLVFAQVREDAWLDLRIVKKLGSDLSVFMIGSGGCTAALLATCPKISWMHITDINSAQIALCQLKLKMLTECDPQLRLQILGHNHIAPQLRMRRLQRDLEILGYSDDVFGSIEQLSIYGPDYMGRYEFLFAALRKKMSEHLSILSDAIDQNKSLGQETIDVLREAFEDIMALPNLVALFGEEATQNSIKPFSEHFFEQTLMILNHPNLLLSQNPYFHQMFFGAFRQKNYYPWITREAPDHIPEIRYSHGNAMEILENSSDCYHFIHLSNILDWLDEKQASDLLQHAYNRLCKGGCVFIRQLNSQLKIPELSQNLEWDAVYTNQLLKDDRSFFYSKLHLGVKR